MAVSFCKSARSFWDRPGRQRRKKQNLVLWVFSHGSGYSGWMSDQMNGARDGCASSLMKGVSLDWNDRMVASYRVGAL